MMTLKILSIPIFTLVLVSIIINWIISPWYVHVSQVKDHTTRWGWGNYETFIREFVKYNWKKIDVYESLQDYEHKAKIHASIIKFNDIGMIMKSPIDFLKVNFFIKKYIKNLQTGKIETKPYNWCDGSLDQYIVHLSEEDKQLIENVYSELSKMKPLIDYADVEEYVVKTRMKYNLKRVK